MRKTKCCDAMQLEGIRRIRRCILPRFHEDEHHLDEHGRWKKIETEENK
jgi:hypothetical protein